MPSKKNIRHNHVFMTNRVIHGDPKPIQPVIRPVVIVAGGGNAPAGMKFK